MSTSPLNHDLHKFSDLGLQLRLPVDLVPAGQYSRLTNAIPIIEGQLITREGVTLIAMFSAQELMDGLGRVAAAGAFADTLVTQTTNSYFVNETVIIEVTDGQAIFTAGTYVVTVVSIVDDFTLTFTPTIPAPGAGGGANYFHTAGGFSTIVGPLSEQVIHTIHRLNEAVLSVPGNRIVGVSTSLFVARLSDPTNFRQLSVSLSGRPLSIVDFRFTRDAASWAIITDGTAMWKYRDGPVDGTTFFFEALGTVAPTLCDTFTAGGVGVLDSTGGTEYDWRHTWVNGQTFTESNPSPVAVTVGSSTRLVPTHVTNPALSGLNQAGVPYDPFSATSATTGTGTVTDGNNQGSRDTNCQWDTFTATPAGNVTSATLTVDCALTLSIKSPGSGNASLQYTTNGGTSWITIVTTTTSIARKIYTVNLNTSFASTLFKFRILLHGQSGFLQFHIPGGHGIATANLYDVGVDVVVTPVEVTLALVNQSANVCVEAPTLPEQTYINLYRRGGSLPDNYRLVGQFDIASLVIGGCGAGFLQINDNVSDTTLSVSPILEFDNDQPVTSVTVKNQPLNFIWGPAGIEARLLGCGDPARPECVYFSKAGNADAWPPENFIEVSSPGTPIIAGCVFNTRIFAFSSEAVFELVEGVTAGAVFTPFPTPSTHGLISPWGLVAATAMYFVAKDGIYMSTGGQEQSIVENDIKPLFPTYNSPGRDVEEYEAVDMAKTDNIRLKWHNDELWFIYSGLTTGIRRTLIYDTLKKRWRADLRTCATATVYSEPSTVSSLLIGTTAGGLYQSVGTQDPNELDVIENFSLTSVTGVPTMSAGTYFALITRLTAVGEVAISFEQGPLTVDPTHVIQAQFPIGPSDTVGWRVYFGTTVSGENQFQAQDEATMPLNRTVLVTAPGTAGTPPTTPPRNDIVVQLRTGAQDQGAPLNRKQYSNVIFDLDPAGANATFPIIITPYINGEVQNRASILVSGNGRQQVPLNLSDFFAFNVEYQIEWSRHNSNPVLYQYDTLYYNEPVGLKHWEQQPATFGFPGYMHTRDAYIAIRSTADVTLTLTLDEVTTQPYTIPSTGGVRKKMYVPFASNKWLELKLALDSTEEFRVYVTDLELRVKPWLGLLGYQVAKPFQEGAA